MADRNFVVDVRGLIASRRETQRPFHDAPAALSGYSPTAMTLFR
jgi:hypothetical protein